MFTSTVPQELFARYLLGLGIPAVEEQWLHLNRDRFRDFMADRANAVTAARIREEMRRINDICEQAVGLLIRAYQYYLIPYDAELPRPHLATILFLDHPLAFDFAWSRYLLLASGSRLSVHFVPAEVLSFDEDRLAGFEGGIRQHFDDNGMGEQCEVSPFEEHGERVILVRHGGHVKTVSQWEGAEDWSTRSYRPVMEDVLIYEPDTRLLRVKAASQRDREVYVRNWCRWIAGDGSLADAALETEIFSLAPFQSGDFNYGGSGPILDVQLRRVTMKLLTGVNAVLTLKADDVRHAFETGPEGLDFSAGLLTSVRLRFIVRPQGRRAQQVSFDIEPPKTITLAEKQHADLIMRYLEEQGVKLR
jgi:hypothetical protein